MKAATQKLRIIALGYIVRGPMGGLTWHHLQYLVGLKRLGHDVYFLEDSGDSPYCCYHPDTNAVDEDPSYGIRYIQRIFDRVDLGDRWAYYDAHTTKWLGPLAGNIEDIVSTADVLLNISCVNPVRPWLERIPVRAFIDTDPVFTQIKNLTDPEHRTFANKHTCFFSYAENIGGKDCTVPDDGLHWRPTRQPIVLSLWQTGYNRPRAHWTTVMQWDSYKALDYDGVTYGMKSAVFDQFVNLPSATGDSFELALGSASAPKERLEKAGWRLVNPLVVALLPGDYQGYLSNSKGEWSVAKHGYVVTNSGWFSERSAAYLASGKPVVVQETGFSRVFSTGRGILSFHSMDEAVERIREANMDFRDHCRYAREVADEYFNSDKVLHHLLANLS